MGEVKINLAIELLSDGKVGFVKSLDSGAHPDFLRASIAAARQISFTPAQNNGAPVTTVRIVEYSFWAQ